MEQIEGTSIARIQSRTTNFNVSASHRLIVSLPVKQVAMLLVQFRSSIGNNAGCGFGLEAGIFKL